MNGDPPIDNATAVDEAEFESQQAFASIVPLKEHRTRLRVAIHECINAGRSEIDVAAEVEMIARRIAVDMLQSTEFQNRIDAAINTRALVIAKRATFDLLQTDEFKDAFEEKFDAMFNYRFDAAFNRLFDQRFLNASESERFKAKVMDIAWPKADAAGDRVRTIEAIFKTTMQENLLETDEFEQKIRAIVDERMTSNLKETIRLRGQTKPDAESQCDHDWVRNDGADETGVICRKCNIVRPMSVMDVPEEIVEIDEDGNVKEVDKRQCDHVWVHRPDLGHTDRCRKCGANRPDEIQQRIDVGIKPIKHDSAQIVQPRQSTDIPPLDHSQIADRPCDVPDD